MSTIESVINNYFQAYLEADSEKLSRAFHSDTKLYSVDADKLDKTEMADWLANLRARKAQGDVRQGHLEIISVDTQDEAAVTRIKIRLPKIEFTDFLSLLKFEGQWKIVGKIYTVNPSAPQ